MRVGCRFSDQQRGIGAILQAPARLAELVIDFNRGLDGGLEGAGTVDAVDAIWSAWKVPDPDNWDEAEAVPRCAVGIDAWGFVAVDRPRLEPRLGSAVPNPHEPILRLWVSDGVAHLGERAAGDFVFLDDRLERVGSLGVPAWGEVEGLHHLEEKSPLQHPQQNGNRTNRAAQGGFLHCRIESRLVADISECGSQTRIVGLDLWKMAVAKDEAYAVINDNTGKWVTNRGSALAERDVFSRRGAFVLKLVWQDIIKRPVLDPLVQGET